MRIHPSRAAVAAMTRALGAPAAARRWVQGSPRQSRFWLALFALAGVALLSNPVAAGIFGDFGDAPNGALAYPAGGVIGHFPTCTGDAEGFVAHVTGHTEVHFGPSVDFETDGNAGVCAWPPYDKDECAGPPDAGLVRPDAYTIGSGGVVATCSGQSGRPLGMPCTTGSWAATGAVDIDVTNNWPTTMYVNVLMDWNQDGVWAGASPCGAAVTPEHVLVNWPVPSGYTGPLSALSPPSFLIGPNLGYVWARFTIGEVPLPVGWNGAHIFDLGETEDYLLRIGALGTDVPNGGPPRGRLELEPGIPNPFRSRSVFAFTMDRPAMVRLTVHDAAGRPVAHLSDGWQGAGRHQVAWNGMSDEGRALPAGTYFVHARSGADVRTTKVALIK